MSSKRSLARFTILYILRQNRMIMINILKYIGLSLLALCLGLYISLKFFWPTQWAVNAPIVQYFTGYGGTEIFKNELGARIKLPDGFNINIYAQDLGHARGLYATANGDLILTTPRSREVKVLLADRNGDGKADGIRTLLKSLNSPHGVQVHDGYLYVAETDAIARVPYNVKTATVNAKQLERIVTNLPARGSHWSRTVHFGPDSMMYVTIGSSCNVCLEKDARRATMVRYKPDGSDEEIFATGLRNTVGFTWHPQTKKLYSVDNGRDWLGDDFPPGEMNIIEQGKFYGWPFLNGNNIPDPDFGKHKDARIAHAVPPAHEFEAHVAPLSIIFLQNKNLPAEYHNAALVTFHGSWNRSTKSGYKIVSLHKQANGKYIEKPFVTGFEKNEKVFGRPVEIVQAPDGTIYFTDDFGSAVYRVSFEALQDFTP